VEIAPWAGKGITRSGSIEQYIWRGFRGTSD
jgi:hypothetical protein